MSELIVYAVCWCGIVLCVGAACFRMGKRTGKKQGLCIARASARHRARSWALPIVKLSGPAIERGYVRFDPRRVRVEFVPAGLPTNAGFHKAEAARAGGS